MVYAAAGKNGCPEAHNHKQYKACKHSLPPLHSAHSPSFAFFVMKSALLFTDVRQL
jgi:hypothetical protein